MVDEAVLRKMQENTDMTRKMLADIEVSIGMRPAGEGQTPGQGTPEDVKKALAALCRIVGGLHQSIAQLQTNFLMRG